MEPLFVEAQIPEVDLIKEAMEARLSDNADTWPQESLKELYKQHPYLSIYDLTVEMVETEGERGFGLGYFLVSSDTSIPSRGPGGEAVQDMSGIRRCKVPIIIKDNKLAPLDVFFDPNGKTKPLNEGRIRVAMHRPQMFDSTAKSPGDVSMSSLIYPPSVDSKSTLGGPIREIPQTKIGEAKPEYILEAIGPSILKTDINRFESEMEKDAELTRALMSNQSTLSLLTYINELDPVDAQTIAKTAGHTSPEPDVVQVSREGETYILKHANSQQFAPEKIEADRPTMVSLAGEDMVAAADQFGASTISTDPVIRNILEDEEVSIIDKFGEYRVKTITGKELLGWVFPTVLDFDGTALPMSLFTNGSESCIQENIVGSLVGKSSNIIRGKPKGYGFFYRVTQSGSVLAFIPVKIKTQMRDDSGVSYIAETMLGEPITVRFAPHLNEIVSSGKNEVTVPTDVRWAGLADSVTALMSEPEQFAKIAHIMQRANQVQIISDKNTWSFRGSAGLNKLANDERESLNGADALFLASALGMESNHAVNMLIKAAEAGSVIIDGCRELRLPKEKYAEATKTAKKLLDLVPAKYSMLKEAAALEDIAVVDKVLSINFLTPENMQIFVNYLPDFEKAISQLGNILVAIRLGMQDIPENSAKNALERLDEVIEGLKKLVFKVNNE
jgi:hypothetical protein